MHAAGYDVLLTDPSREDSGGNLTLEARAIGATGRFQFAGARMHPDDAVTRHASISATPTTPLAGRAPEVPGIQAVSWTM
jgi:hypothetical protein